MRRPRLCRSLSSTAAMTWLILLGLAVSDAPPSSWVTLVTCAAGTLTACAFIARLVPPVVGAWRAGYRACARDLAADRPDLDGYTLT